MDVETHKHSYACKCDGEDNDTAKGGLADASKVTEWYTRHYKGRRNQRATAFCPGQHAALWAAQNALRSSEGKAKREVRAHSPPTHMQKWAASLIPSVPRLAGLPRRCEPAGW